MSIKLLFNAPRTKILTSSCEILLSSDVGALFFFPKLAIRVSVSFTNERFVGKSYWYRKTEKCRIICN